MSRKSARRNALRCAQREANGEMRLYSDEAAEGCRIVRWISEAAGESMVREHNARRVVNQSGDTIGYQLHRSFMTPQPVMMAKI